MQNSKQHFFRLLACQLTFTAISLVQPAHAAVNDIFPGDYYPIKPGITTAALYAYDRAQVGPYSHGHQLLDGESNSIIIATRFTHTFLIGETAVAAVVVLPWAKSHVSPAPLARFLGEESEGFSDIRLGLTAWAINNPANAHYLALSSMVVAPTGEYDKNQRLNIGENRWKLIMSGGWQKDITRQFLVELSPEVVFYGDNNDYVNNGNLEQKTSAALTGYLRYRATPTWHVHVGGQLNRGGETMINGVDQHNSPNNNRLMAGMTWFIPSNHQIILRAARDTAIDNGFRTNREIALRYQLSF